MPIDRRSLTFHEERPPLALGDFGNQLAQHAEVDHIPLFTGLLVGAFFRFQVTRNHAEPFIAQYVTESLQTDLAMPNMFVPIDATAQRLLADVEMQRRDAAMGQHVVELFTEISNTRRLVD